MTFQQFSCPTRPLFRALFTLVTLNCVIALTIVDAAIAQNSQANQTQLASLFTDGMVLQREQSLPVWGWTQPGASVAVSFAGQTLTGQADAQGNFSIRLAKLETSDQPRTLTVEAAGETLKIDDVLVGEVWLCSGQSNMQRTVEQSANASEEISNATYPLIRFFKPAFATSLKPEKTCKGVWRVCSPKTVGDFSAAAYYFGRALHRELNVPIGLINPSVGATCVEAWSPPESLKRFPSVMAYQANLDARAVDFHEDEAAARYDEEMEAWRQKSAEAEAAGKRKVKRPEKEIHPHENKNYPGNLYHAMIRPLVPYGIRGAIWYQGERNAKTIKEAILYRDLLENLTLRWREDWDEAFPFYAVQLVNFKKPASRPVEDSPWAFIRESFLKFQNEVPGTGIAVGIDVGEAKDIHPKNKQAIGDRLARQALAKTYGRSIVADGPLYKSFRSAGDKIVIQFQSVGSGLMAKDGDRLKSFAIAGADKKFVHATAEIVGDTVVVSSDKVTNPVAVRYAWANNPQGCNLFNKEGLPASPFRTDAW